MSDQTVPVVIVPDLPVEEKKKFHFNRKVAGGFAAGILATVVAAVAAVKLSDNSDSSDPAESENTTDETFVDTDPTS